MSNTAFDFADVKTFEQEYDIVVVGGGTAGPMAAIKAKERNPNLRILLIDKANVKRSGAISMGMDGLNNAVIPGHATPEQYTKEITIANDGIVNQATVYAYAKHSFATIEQLDRWGVKFEKDERTIWRALNSFSETDKLLSPTNKTIIPTFDICQSA